MISEWKTSLKINGLPLLRRCLMSPEQIPPLACDLPPTAIGVTGVEARAGRRRGLGERGSPAGACSSLLVEDKGLTFRAQQGKEPRRLVHGENQRLSTPKMVLKGVFRAVLLHGGFLQGVWLGRGVWFGEYVEVVAWGAPITWCMQGISQTLHSNEKGAHGV